MKSMATNVLLAGLLTLFPLFASAQLQDELSCEEVEDMLEAGRSPAEVVNALYQRGMALTGATVFAMECVGDPHRVAIAEAGVGLASNIKEATGVARAVAYASGESSSEALAARKALQTAEQLAKQPETYKSDYTPHGGGAISPST